MSEEEVAALMAALLLMTPEELAAVGASLSAAALTMSRIHDAAMLNRILTQMRLVAGEGWDAIRFAEWLETKGAAWDASYSRLTFRNATQQSYNLARYTMQQRELNRLKYQILIYDAVMDSVTTDFCQHYNAKWWPRAQFPSSLYPPNHHHCRSVVRMATKAAANRLGAGAKLDGLDTTAGAPEWQAAPPDGWIGSLEHRQAVMERGLGL
jgi:hypothetical protein